MRVIRFLGVDGVVHTGEEPSDPSSAAAVLSGDLYAGTLRRSGESVHIAKILPAVVPCDIFCIGLNYMKHYEESAKKRGIALPDKPVVFMKPGSAVIGTGDDIWLPQIEHGEKLDWEVELGVVIGKTCRNVKAANALDYVAGYCVTNDVSSRHWQHNGGGSQWIKGKSFDTHCPIGPVLVTPEDLPNPQALRVTTRVNGEVQQDSNTNDMIFTVAQCIEWLSDNMTLRPGCLIMTGTPAGVAAGRTPPNFLKVGDVVECEIDHCGKVTNRVAIPPKL